MQPRSWCLVTHRAKIEFTRTRPRLGVPLTKLEGVAGGVGSECRDNLDLCVMPVEIGASGRPAVGNLIFD